MEFHERQGLPRGRLESSNEEVIFFPIQTTKLADTMPLSEAGMRSSIITAMHYCVPENVLTNDALEERFGQKALKSIAKMAGILERRVVRTGQTASDLAFWAAKRLIEDRQLDPGSIDLLIFASQTGDYQIPATACTLHNRLGLSDRCAAFDINLGCSSFPYSLSVANGMICSRVARRALVLNADTLTTLIHPKDRGLVPLCGDGAVASLLEPAPDDCGFDGFYLGTDGTGAEHLMIPASGARNPRSEETRREFLDDKGNLRTMEHLYMNGPAVFFFSMNKVPEVIRHALDAFGLTLEDIDLVLLHQANKMMVDLIYKALDVPANKQFLFMETVGNLSGASTPLVLCEAWRRGLIRGGSRTLLVAFGAGLSWGITAIRWPNELPSPIRGPIEPGDAQ